MTITETPTVPAAWGGPDDGRRYTFGEVDVLSDGDVSIDFGPDTVFVVTTTGVAPDRIATRQSYVDEGDTAFVVDVDEIAEIYRSAGWAGLPPLIARADGHIVDGAHRLAAAVEAGLDLTAIPAFTPADPRADDTLLTDPQESP